MTRRHIAGRIAAAIVIVTVIAFFALLPWGIQALWLLAIVALFALRHGLARLSRSIGPNADLNCSHKDASA